jgi:type II secretory pathway pseudopilin PulG
VVGLKQNAKIGVFETIMKKFSKEEIKFLAIIFCILLIMLGINFKASYRKARDAQRKGDVEAMMNGLEDGFFKNFGYFPSSTSDGKILACKGPDTKYDEKEARFLNLVACEWGKDALVDLLDPTFPPYITTLPKDPQITKGVNYKYFSNGRRYQIFVSLEGKTEAEFNAKIEARGISCGVRLCNYGKAYSSTSLYKTIDEYENELLLESK